MIGVKPRKGDKPDTDAREVFFFQMLCNHPAKLLAIGDRLAQTGSGIASEPLGIRDHRNLVFSVGGCFPALHLKLGDDASKCILQVFLMAVS